MATLFFAREGLDPNRATSVIEIPLSEFLAHFEGLAATFFSGPPEINPDSKPSPYSPYTLVVLEVEDDEIGAEYSKPGFYYFPSLRPKECADALGIEMPN
jgi:hypothetical protein